MVGTAKFDTSEINTLIRKHWRKEFKNGKSFHYWPMQYPSLNKHCFLFVGLNPSLKAKDKETAEFVLESKESLLDIARMTEIIDKDEEYRGGPDRNKKCGYPICQEIFRELNKGHKRLESWDYIDLFSNRILKASDLKKELDIKDSQEPVSWPQDESAAKQLKIFKELLDSLKPKAVLVANALASHILIKEMRLEGTKKGYSSLPSSNVLIFFSSTFSGGHLDVFSRRRLEDQIIRVVKNL